VTNLNQNSKEIVLVMTFSFSQVRLKPNLAVSGLAISGATLNRRKTKQTEIPCAYFSESRPYAGKKEERKVLIQPLRVKKTQVKNGLKCKRINWVNKWIKLSLFSFRSLKERPLRSSKKRNRVERKDRESMSVMLRMCSICSEKGDKKLSRQPEEKKLRLFISGHGMC